MLRPSRDDQPIPIAVMLVSVAIMCACAFFVALGTPMMG
jgi:hypothetical protein